MNKIPEDLLCPICLDFPENEVYQCGQGHLLCSKCIANLQKCPQCLEPFEKSKIRNRVVESLLEPYKVDCPHKHLGCDKKFFKDKLATHEQICTNGGERLNICKEFNIQCEALVNIRDVAATVEHLKSHDFNEFWPQPTTTRLILRVPYNHNHNLSVDFWCPTFYHIQGQLFLLRLGWNAEKQLVISWLELGADSKMEKRKYQMQMMIRDVANKGRDLKWTLPVAAMMSRNGKLISEEFRVSSDLIKENYGQNGTFLLEFKLINLPDSTINSSSTTSERPCIAVTCNCVIC